MEYYELHPLDPQRRFISKAVKIIKDGGVIIYPTDTVYGIGCDIYNKEALERIFRIKNESNTKLFSFVCSDLKDIAKYARVSDYAYKMMKHLLPGPYTFILPASKTVPKTLWTKRKTVGIRVPNNAVALKLVHEVEPHERGGTSHRARRHHRGRRACPLRLKRVTKTNATGTGLSQGTPIMVRSTSLSDARSLLTPKGVYPAAPRPRTSPTR